MTEKLISPLDEVNALIERVKVFKKEYDAAEKQIFEATAKKRSITDAIIGLRSDPNQKTASLNKVVEHAYHTPGAADIEVMLKDLLYYREGLL